jgi:hypothetical protein
MEPFITKELVIQYELDCFCIDASDIDLPIGKYPHQIATNMGTGMPFMLWSVNGDYAIYRQSCGNLVLRVFND